MLDLQVLGIILTVILFSIGSIILVSKFPRGKTFDEMLEEKRQFKAQLMAAALQGNEKQKKENSKKSRKYGHQKQNQKGKKQILSSKAKEFEFSVEQSDSQSDLSVYEEEPIENEEFLTVGTISLKTTNKNKKMKNKGNLITKSESISDALVEDPNQLEDTHIKDAVELHHININESSYHQGPKKIINKKGKKPTGSIGLVDEVYDRKQIDDVLIEGNIASIKEKNVKKRKVGQRDVPTIYGEDDTVRSLLCTLSTVEITRSEIQILIDFLLNKQHDTTAKDPTEWTEGKSDTLQKLKKQLQDREKQLHEEQQASAALQTKLRELRSEINGEKSQFNATIKFHIEELNNKKKELQNLATELHYCNEKHNTEKHTLSQQCKQLQATIIQLKNEQNSSQEAIQKLQQFTVQHEQLKQEMQRIDSEHRQFIDGLQKTLAERDIKFVQRDNEAKYIENELRQRTQELGVCEQELQCLRAEVTHKAEELDHIYKTCENLKVKMAEAQSKASNQNHLDDANKVEIKNLQNALDSSKKELNSLKSQLHGTSLEMTGLREQLEKRSMESEQQVEEMKTLVTTLQEKMADSDIKILEYENSIKIAQEQETELRKELELQKQKNNDLRTKNWKLIEALQAAQISKCSRNENVNSQVPHELVVQAVSNEQIRTKDMFCKLLPELPTNGPTDFTDWLEFATYFIRNKLSNIHGNDASNSCNINNHKENHGTGEMQHNLHDMNGGSVNDKPNEKLLLVNAQLQKSLDEYKSIVADTEQVLRNLEAKVAEKDTYWLSVVQSKDEEINSLKPAIQS